MFIIENAFRDQDTENERHFYILIHILRRSGAKCSMLFLFWDKAQQIPLKANP